MHLGGIKNISAAASKTLFGPGTYSNNITGTFSVSGNSITITGACTVAPDGTTGAAVVVCDSLTLDGASASLTPTTNCKGLLIFAKSSITLKNGAKLNIDKKGKAGNFGNLTPLNLMPASIQSKFKTSALAAYVVQGEGAAGAVGSASSGISGTAAGNGTMKSGGGGSGSMGCCSSAATGAGGKGGPCCGGAGSGATHRDRAGTAAAGPYGGPGSNGSVSGGPGSAGGGAGDPVGVGAYVGGSDAGVPQVPAGAGGGLLMLFTPALLIDSGCIVSADGAMGGAGTNGHTLGGGGSAGGGIVCVVTKAGGLTNNGTLRANGGPIAQYASQNIAEQGGPGGAGSVNIFTV